MKDSGARRLQRDGVAWLLVRSRPQRSHRLPGRTRRVGGVNLWQRSPQRLHRGVNRFLDRKRRDQQILYIAEGVGSVPLIGKQLRGLAYRLLRWLALVRLLGWLAWLYRLWLTGLLRDGRLGIWLGGRLVCLLMWLLRRRLARWVSPLA